MIVVSDTSPLNYLILVGCIDVLPQLFGQVYAPSSVVIELGHPPWSWCSHGRSCGRLRR